MTMKRSEANNQRHALRPEATVPIKTVAHARVNEVNQIDESIRTKEMKAMTNI